MKEANKDQMAQFGFEQESDDTLKEMREKAIEDNNNRQRELEEQKRKLQTERAKALKELEDAKKLAGSKADWEQQKLEFEEKMKE